jgi:hypothetical protein
LAAAQLLAHCVHADSSTRSIPLVHSLMGTDPDGHGDVPALLP